MSSTKRKIVKISTPTIKLQQSKTIKSLALKEAFKEIYTLKNDTSRTNAQAINQTNNNPEFGNVTITRRSSN